MPTNREFHLGVVPYLNVQPLIWSLRGREDVAFHEAVPSQLAGGLVRGLYDAAIMPVFEYLRSPGQYEFVPGVCIGSRGPVDSVVLFSSVPLRNVKRVILDPSSLTSVHLLKVLMAERKGPVDYIHHHWGGSTLAPGDAALLIGDPALAQLGVHPEEYDLATLWRENTGLPFVFAVWALRVERDNSEVIALLQDAKEQGIAHINEVARDAAPGTPYDVAYIFRYFHERIHYGLGEEELRGMEEFARKCRQQGFI